MYAGEIVEEAPVGELFAHAHHPYTEGLLAAMPRVGQERERLATIPGTVPPPTRGRRAAASTTAARTRGSAAPPSIRRCIRSATHTSRAVTSRKNPRVASQQPRTRRGDRVVTASPAVQPSTVHLSSRCSPSANLVKHFPIKNGAFGKPAGVVRAVTASRST